MDEMKKTGQQAGQQKPCEKTEGKGCGSCCTPERKEEKPMREQGQKKGFEQKPYSKDAMKPEGKKPEEGK